MMRAYWLATDFTSGQQKEYLSLMNKDAAKGDDGVLNLIINNLNYVPAEELKKAAHGAGYEKQLHETLDMIMSAEKLGEQSE